ncbi:MAG TPA: MurR/RpiR family transcriptional regulator [Terriglobales bacterium]|nr:MurR/RpiR family transcriptional regulator [Terriglobales bacterium]
MAQDGIEMPAEAPRDFANLRRLLLARKDDLPKRLAQVAAYTMANPDDIAFGTAASIAERAQVQPSTLVRFAQALGYEGFSDLQAIFRDRLRDRVPSYGERIEALRSYAPEAAKSTALLAGFTEAAERSVHALKERISTTQVEEAVHILSTAETIYLLGQRRSFPVTSYMNYAFGKLGVKSVLIGSAVGTDSETISFATAKDAVIAVSFTPYAPSTLTHARQFRDKRVPMVVITDSPFSPLVPDRGMWFEIVEADFAGFRSLSATMALAMTLTVAVAEARR